MNNKTLFYDEIIKFSWKTVINNFGFFALVYLVYMSVSFTPGLLNIFVFSKLGLPFLPPTVTLVSCVINWVMAIGLIKITLKFADGEKAKVSELFSHWGLLFWYVVTAIVFIFTVLGWQIGIAVLGLLLVKITGVKLFFLLSVLGCILMIYPGMVFVYRYQFCFYANVDKRMGPVESLKYSDKATNGFKWQLVLLTLMVLFINIAGFLALIAGLFITAPLTAIAYAYTYRFMEQRITPEITETSI